MTANAPSQPISTANALADPAPALGVALAPLTPAPISELRAWLTDAELMLRDLGPADPRYAAGFAIWTERHDAYMARARAEEEPA